jgi:hypothetical protein
VEEIGSLRRSPSPASAESALDIRLYVMFLFRANNRMIDFLKHGHGINSSGCKDIRRSTEEDGEIKRW